MARQSKAQRILTHSQVWNALDRLAERAGMSASGLAKRSGLDPTTFNKSKRITADGRERWPSTESVSKALAATNSSIDTFVQLIGDGARSLQSVPLLGLLCPGPLPPALLCSARSRLIPLVPASLRSHSWRQWLLPPDTASSTGWGGAAAPGCNDGGSA
jgi:hypothetical protein